MGVGLMALSARLAPGKPEFVAERSSATADDPRRSALLLFERDLACTICQGACWSNRATVLVGRKGADSLETSLGSLSRFR